ncbi:MAG: MGH1-like glycoside hydrolase domain-containing protein, partial [Candidatus Saccharimonadales bacterium]
QLVEAVEKVLADNDRGNYTAPSVEIYPHQWLWDSCFIAIGRRHLDVERAKMELTSLCRGQWSNGMMPNIIFRDDDGYRHERNSWRSWISPNSPDDVATSGITQPPMLAEAVVRVSEKMPLIERRSWFKLMWPTLIAYHQWIYNERDPHQEGLALLIHPWEVGMDNTPPWISELHQHLLPGWIRFIQKTHLDYLIDLLRRDARSIPIDERFNTIEVLALYDVQRRLRRKRYDIDKILDHSLFDIEDLTFNCILVRANENLRKISKTLREQIPSDLDKAMKKTAEELEKLWDPYSNQYYSRDFITHNLIKEPSIAALMPLYAGTISKERAEILVRMLENENEFGPAYP